MRPFYVLMMAMFLAATASQSAFGFVEFHKEWVKMYVDEDDDSEEAEEYRGLVAKGKYRCLVCHQGKKKDNHNPYGIHFVGVLGKEDKKDTEKIVQTLEEIGKMHSDPDDEESPTYNELIADHKWPGGTLEELEEEPAEDAEESEGEN